MKKKTVNEKENVNIEEMDKTILLMNNISDELKQLYVNQRKVYLTNPYWGFGELLILIESKLIKMKQAITIEKRQEEIKDLAVYCIIALALQKYYDRKNEYPTIYE